MLIPTDHIELLQNLGSYSFALTTPPELAGKLQTIPGSTVDKIFTAIEILYSFRDQIEADGLTVLGQLAGFGLANHWDFPGQTGRMRAIYDSSLGALGETELPADFEQPEPVVTYRTDQKDWRESIEPNLDQLKAGKKAQVMKLLDDKLSAGFTPTTGPLTGKTLQNRNLDDRTNWLTSQAAYQAQVSAGNGAVTGANFRTADNTTVNCSFADGLNTLLAMAAWGAGLYGRSWSLKDEIDAAADQAALDAIDITAGW